MRAELARRAGRPEAGRRGATWPEGAKRFCRTAGQPDVAERRGRKRAELARRTEGRKAGRRGAT